MLVKIDTRQKFHVITLNSTDLSANMTAELSNSLTPLLQNDVKNIVFKLTNLQTIDEAAGESLVRLQQHFYENNASLVFCELTQPVESFLDEKDLLELMNTTPTESEAWDIVQMEEIERELFSEDEEENPGPV
ncbi:MAG TPA: STAS domain-containing protein [Chitinophagaceae bacterium]|nr:STAS domain-containing protein [Chitinophagaceae bacterium]